MARVGVAWERAAEGHGHYAGRPRRFGIDEFLETQSPLPGPAGETPHARRLPAQVSTSLSRGSLLLRFQSLAPSALS